MTPLRAGRRVPSQLPLGFAAGIPLYLSGATLSKWLADIGGLLTDRIGVFRVLLYFGALQALANIGYLLLARGEPTLLRLIVASRGEWPTRL